MSLKTEHESIDEIPEPHRELYTEQDGKFILTGIEGVKTAKDIERVTAAQRHEIDNHKKTKDKLAVWNGLDHTETMRRLDRIKELEVAASGKVEDQDKRIEELVEARIHSRTAPIERELAKYKDQNAALDTEVKTQKKKETKRVIQDNVRESCKKLNVRDGNTDDAIVTACQIFELNDDGKPVTVENSWGVEPGLTPEMWLNDVKTSGSRAWWPESQGSGSKGAGIKGFSGNNPWSYDTWNVTSQSAFIKAHGDDQATKMAKAAGTTIRGSRVRK